MNTLTYVLPYVRTSYYHTDPCTLILECSNKNYVVLGVWHASDPSSRICMVPWTWTLDPYTAPSFDFEKSVMSDFFLTKTTIKTQWV
jgi:hypothetical protein